MTDTFDRTQLDGKDREQLSEIASALGVKAISRMRKADLVEAICLRDLGGQRVEALRIPRRGRARSVRRSRAATTSPLSQPRKTRWLPADEPVDEMTLIRPADRRALPTAPSTRRQARRANLRRRARPAFRQDQSSESGGGQNAHDQQAHDEASQHQPGSQSQQVRDGRRAGQSPAPPAPRARA